MLDFLRSIATEIAAALSGFVLLFSGTQTAPPQPPPPERLPTTNATQDQAVILADEINRSLAESDPQRPQLDQSDHTTTSQIVNPPPSKPSPTSASNPSSIRELSNPGEAAAPAIPPNTAITEPTLNARLAALANDLRLEIAQKLAAIPRGGGGGSSAPLTVTSNATYVTRDFLDHQVAAIADSVRNSIPDPAELTDATIPDDITASNYLALSGGTLTGGLDIEPAGVTDGTEVLRLGVERPWVFSQGGTGASSGLNFTNYFPDGTPGNKTWGIRTNGHTDFQFYDSNSESWKLGLRINPTQGLQIFNASTTQRVLLSPTGASSFAGDLSVGGTLTANALSVAAISSGGAVEAPHFTATSSTATSSFAGSILALGTAQFANSSNFFGQAAFGATGTTTIATDGTISTPSITATNAATPSQFLGGLLSLASTTIGDGTQAGGLTISGGATTTGNAYFAGNVGIGTSSAARFTIASSGSGNQIVVASSTGPQDLFRLTSSGSIVLPRGQGINFLRDNGTTVDAGISYDAGSSQINVSTFNFVVGAAAADTRINGVDGRKLHLGIANVAAQHLLTLDTTTNVGIASTSPWAKLSVTNTGSGPSFVVEDSTSPDSTPFIIDASGNVGIGTANPTSQLELLAGNSLRFGGGISASQIYLGPSNNRSVSLTESGFRVNWHSAGGYNHELSFASASADGMQINRSGQIRFAKGDGRSFNNAFFIDPDKSTTTIDAGHVSGDNAPTTNLVIRTRNTTGSSGNHNSGNLQLITGSPLNAGSAGYISFHTNDTANERMRITDTGNVGIGTTDPLSKLNVQGDNAGLTDLGQLVVSGATDSNKRLSLTFDTTNNRGSIQAVINGTGYVPLLLNPTGGNTGIGTTTPTSTLTVDGTVSFDGLTGSTGAGSLCLSATNEVVFNSGADECLSSTRATKHAIDPLTLDALAQVLALQPVSFVYNNGEGRTRYGLIAEDAAAVDQHFATYDAEGTISGIDNRAVLAAVIKAIQSLATITGTFKENLTHWLADAANGIDKIFAKELIAENVIAKRGSFDELCVGAVCVTESQFLSVFSGQSASAQSAAAAAADTHTDAASDGPPAREATPATGAATTSTSEEPAPITGDPSSKPEAAADAPGAGVILGAPDDSSAPGAGEMTDTATTTTPDSPPPAQEGASPVPPAANDNDPPASNEAAPSEPPPTAAEDNQPPADASNEPAPAPAEPPAAKPPQSEPVPAPEATPEPANDNTPPPAEALPATGTD